MTKDRFFIVLPPRRHRILVFTDLIFEEVSTHEVHDVIRVQDDASRGDGRVESEHTP
jgi:hypothetical protein